MTNNSTFSFRSLTDSSAYIIKPVLLLWLFVLLYIIEMKLITCGVRVNSWRETAILFWYVQLIWINITYFFWITSHDRSKFTYVPPVRWSSSNQLILVHKISRTNVFTIIYIHCYEMCAVYQGSWGFVLRWLNFLIPWKLVFEDFMKEAKNSDFKIFIRKNFLFFSADLIINF